MFSAGLVDPRGTQIEIEGRLVGKLDGSRMSSTANVIGCFQYNDVDSTLLAGNLMRCLCSGNTAANYHNGSFRLHAADQYIYAQ